MKKISVSEIISQAWNCSTNSNGLILAILLLVFATIGSIPIIGVIAEAGLIALLMGLYRGKYKEISTQAWDMPFSVYLNYFVVSLLYGVAVVIGFICCILPGIFISIRWWFAPYYALEHPEASISECFSASWKMTENNFFELFLLQIVFIFIVMAGFICCCVGVLFAAVICQFATVIAFYALLPDAPSPRTEQPSQETINEGTYNKEY